LCAVPFAVQHAVAWNQNVDIDSSYQGKVRLHVAIDEHNNVKVTLLDSTDVRLNAPVIAVYAGSRFQVSTFRCIGTPWAFDAPVEIKSGGAIQWVY